MLRETYWDRVYATRSSEEVSWYAPHLERSLTLIDAIGLELDAPIIDVGGGTSTLVSDLVEHGYSAVSVLDVSTKALETAQEQLGERAARVTWIAGDVVDVELPRAGFALWHDRAAFHFLTKDEDRAAYVRQLEGAVAPGGHVILATFGPEGPERCSGLPVRRSSEADLEALLGGGFERMRGMRAIHRTPSGGRQEFVYCLFRRIGA